MEGKLAIPLTSTTHSCIQLPTLMRLKRILFRINANCPFPLQKKSQPSSLTMGKIMHLQRDAAPSRYTHVNRPGRRRKAMQSLQYAVKAIKEQETDTNVIVLVCVRQVSPVMMRQGLSSVSYCHVKTGPVTSAYPQPASIVGRPRHHG